VSIRSLEHADVAFGDALDKACSVGEDAGFPEASHAQHRSIRVRVDRFRNRVYAPSPGTSTRSGSGRRREGES
jgi:hypothetical protein